VTHTEWSISSATQCDFCVDDHTELQGVTYCKVSHEVAGFQRNLGESLGIIGEVGGSPYRYIILPGSGVVTEWWWW